MKGFRSTSNDCTFKDFLHKLHTSHSDSGFAVLNFHIFFSFPSRTSPARPAPVLALALDMDISAKVVFFFLAILFYGSVPKEHWPDSWSLQKKTWPYYINVTYIAELCELLDSYGQSLHSAVNCFFNPPSLVLFTGLKTKFLAFCNLCCLIFSYFSFSSCKMHVIYLT